MCQNQPFLIQIPKQHGDDTLKCISCQMQCSDCVGQKDVHPASLDPSFKMKLFMYLFIYFL